MAGQLRGNKVSGLGRGGQHFQSFFAVFFATIIEGPAHHDFFALAVNLFVKKELGIFARFVNGPAGQTFGHLNYVLLGITAIDADRVQFHHFTAVVLVQSTILFVFGGDGRAAIWICAVGCRL